MRALAIDWIYTIGYSQCSPGKKGATMKCALYFAFLSLLSTIPLVSQNIGRDQEGIAVYTEAVRTDPTDGIAWGNLGKAYLDSGDYKDAEEATKKAVEIFTQKFKNVPNPIHAEIQALRDGETLASAKQRGYEADERPADIGMLMNYWLQLADISDRQHKKREAASYRRSAERAADVLQSMQRSSPIPAPNSQLGQQGNGARPLVESQPASRPPATAAVCPPAITACAEDNMSMNATGQMRYMNGVREYEFAHEITVPSSSQPYDPNNPQPYKAPRMVRHTTWVVCAQQTK